MTVKNPRDVSQVIETIDIISWTGPAASNFATPPIEAVENGSVLYFPHLAFAPAPGESGILSPLVASARAKNVSSDANEDSLKGAVGNAAEFAAIAATMRRYHEHSLALVNAVLPRYAGALEIGRTSFRPVEIEGRPTSARKDDTRLHIDAFPSTPTGGKRILCVFSNVNPSGQGRQWRLGAPFEEVACDFAPAMPRQMPGSAWLLAAIGVTKARRTDYDRAMLAIHDAMKADDAYQRGVVQNEFGFPPGSSWIVFTDKVSHAANAGQHIFEQTFYRPVSAMADPAKAPLRILERLAGRALA